MNSIEFNKTWTISPLRGEIRRILGELEGSLAELVDGAKAKKVRICADELLRNALEHGIFRISNKEHLQEGGRLEAELTQLEAKSWDSDLSLTVSQLGDRLALEVSCAGEPFLFGTNTPRADQCSGRGLTLVQKISEELWVSPEKNLVRAIISITGP